MAENHVDVTEATGDNLGTAVREAWQDADHTLIDERSNFWCNLAFFEGHQWVWWDRNRRELNEVTRESDQDRVLATINKIRPRINSLLGRMTTRPLVFEVAPTAVDDATLTAAATGSHVLEARRVDDNWEELRTDALFSTLMSGTSLVVPEWDAEADEVTLEAFNLAEFSLEPGTRRPRDARWMIVARALPPKQIKAWYDLDFTPKGTHARVSSPLHRRLSTSRGAHGLGSYDHVETATVYKFWQRPDRKGNGGRVVTVVDDQVIEEIDWPYPFDELPGHVFRADIIPMQWMGDTPMNSARPVQVAYNAIRSTMLENAKLAGNNRLMIPIGAGLDDFEWSDEPGQIIPFIPDNGEKPQYLQAPSLPRDFRYETERLDNELDDILYTHATSRGMAPGDRNSGLALSILAEKDDTPLGTMARDQQQGWSRIGAQVLMLYAEHVSKPRTSRTKGPDNVPVTIEWNGKMLGNQFDVRVPLDTVMPHSRAATQAMLVDLKQSFPEQFQGLDASTFMRLLDLHGVEHLRETMDDDVANAMYENTMMAQGEVMIPEPWHDHTVHMAEHNRERNSVRYRLASDEVKETFRLHMEAHQKMIAEEIAKQQALNAAMPGLGAMPQADEPVGSMVMRDHIDANQGPAPAMPAGPRPMPPS